MKYKYSSLKTDFDNRNLYLQDYLRLNDTLFITCSNEFKIKYRYILTFILADIKYVQYESYYNRLDIFKSVLNNDSYVDYEECVKNYVNEQITYYITQRRIYDECFFEHMTDEHKIKLVNALSRVNGFEMTNVHITKNCWWLIK
jgi:hypothetical protein